MCFLAISNKMIMKNLILVGLSSLIILVSCTHDKNDLERNNLKGKVKSRKEYLFSVSGEKFGDPIKGSFISSSPAVSP